jgi:hypothetical protein
MNAFLKLVAGFFVACFIIMGLIFLTCLMFPLTPEPDLPDLPGDHYELPHQAKYIPGWEDEVYDIDGDGIIELWEIELGYCVKWARVSHWVGKPYKVNVFDCSEMSARVCECLDRMGFDARIAVGNYNGVGHAWVYVYNVSANWRLGIESTGAINPIFNWGGYHLTAVYNDQYEANFYYPGEFDPQPTDPWPVGV